jgi:hypothetical protein
MFLQVFFLNKKMSIVDDNKYDEKLDMEEEKKTYAF